MSKEMNKKKSSYHDAVILLAAVIIGGAAGLIFGEKATIVKPIGTIFINLMFCILVPLVFFSIASSVATFDNMKKLGKILSSVFLVFVCTGTIASLIMIILVQILPYAQAEGFDINSVTAETAKATPIGDHIVNMFTVSDFPNLISKSHILPLIVFSIFFGVSVSMVGNKGRAIAEGMLNLADVMYKMIGILMKFAPLGLGAYFADLTGTYGPKLLGTYFQGVILFYPTLLIYFLIAYTVCTYMAGGVQGVKTYYKNILAPALTAFGTRSSAASIPGQIEACNNIGVPKDVSSVVIPLGATCHMDGSAMSSIFKIVMLCAIFQMPLAGVKDYAFVFFVALFSSVAQSAVPGGGSVASIMIISMFGFPDAGLPILIILGNLCEPVITLVNSSGDTGAAMLVSRLAYGKDWMNRKENKTEILNA